MRQTPQRSCLLDLVNTEYMIMIIFDMMVVTLRAVLCKALRCVS